VVNNTTGGRQRKVRDITYHPLSHRFIDSSQLYYLHTTNNEKREFE
jgi:hypothetical protein